MKMSNTKEFGSVDQIMEAQTRYPRPEATEMPIADALPFSYPLLDAPLVDDAERLIDLSRREHQRQGQVPNRHRAVLGLRWSDKHGTVVLVDLLTGKVEGEWHPKITT